LLEIAAIEGPFAENGDSGSAVVNIQNQVVGLLVGATLDFSTGYAVPIARIRDRFQIPLEVSPTSNLATREVSPTSNLASREVSPTSNLASRVVAS
jgi:S1-C subfamily serine protease